MKTGKNNVIKSNKFDNNLCMDIVVKSNKIIKKINKSQIFFYQKCKIITLKRPYPITDTELNALFLGLVKIIRQKIEYEASPQTKSSDYEKLMILYKSKIKECNRLKNEKLYLMQQIKELKKTTLI